MVKEKKKKKDCQLNTLKNNPILSSAYNLATILIRIYTNKILQRNPPRHHLI